MLRPCSGGTNKQLPKKPTPNSQGATLEVGSWELGYWELILLLILAEQVGGLL